MLVTVKAALPANLSSIPRGQILADLVVPHTSNGPFCVRYPERSLTCKFELNRVILDFD